MKILNTKIICMVLLQATLFIKMSAQDVLNLIEITTGGRVYDIRNDIKDEKITRYSNIDINSTVNITLQTDSIKKEAYKWMNVEANLPIERIKSISIILQKRADLLEKIKFQSSDISAERVSLEEFANNVLPLLIIVNSLDENNTLRINANKIFSIGEKDASLTYIKFFDLLQNEINSISDEYKKVVEENKVLLRLGAFVNQSPVHLEFFDSYKEGDYFFVQPFITTISDEEKKEFDIYKELAKKANDDASKAFKDKIKEVVNPMLDSIKQAVKNRFNLSVASFDASIARISIMNDEIRGEIEKSKNEISIFIAKVDLLIASANDVNNIDYLNNILTSIQNTSISFNELNTNLNNSIIKLSSLIPINGNTALADLESSYSLGEKTFSDAIRDIKTFFDNKLQLNISLSEKLTESILKLGDEVNNIPLDNIPSETTLDLKYTGNRKNGDRLYFKAVLVKNSSNNTKVEEKTIDFISIGLYQIRLHNSIEPVVLLVDNLSDQYPSKKQFQFDPSYSVLFKWGSRKYTFWNDFIDLGFGVNMATLDFNSDDNPEVGIGIVLSLFKDYIQSGFGRNIGTDQYYWFFGIRLPFLGINFTGNPKI